MHFPAPRLIVDKANGITVIGYKDSVVFPISVSVPQGNENVVAAGSFQFGACRSVCVIQQVEFNEVLPAHLDIWEDQITKARASATDRVDAKAKGLRFSCHFRPDNGGSFNLSAVVEPEVLPNADVKLAPEYPDDEVWFSEIKTQVLADGTVGLDANMKHSGGYFPSIDRSKLTVTLVTPDSATEYSSCSGST